ncbi:MAG: DNA primase [Mariprofundaceae bacterium]
MAIFSESFLDEVLSRSDLVQVIGMHVELKRSGSNFMGLCPFHHEKSPSFSVSADKQFYHCFGCGKGGDAFQFLIEHHGYSFPESVEFLAEKAGLEVPRDSNVDQAKEQQQAAKRQRALDLLSQVSECFVKALDGDLGAQARSYIKQRGLPEHIVKDYQLGFAPDGYGFMQAQFNADGQRLKQLESIGMLFKGEHGYADRFRGRLMFPIKDRRGAVVGFGGRVMGDGSPKYLNSPDTPFYHKSEVLYGFSEHRDAIRKAKLLIVVEGYMDVLALAAHGLPLAVASSGTAMGEKQLRDVFRLCDSPVFCFDGDKAGYQAAWRVIERMLPLLKPEYKPRFLYLPDGEDPDSLLKKEAKASFEMRIKTQAKPALETWLLGLQNLAGSGADGVARMAKKADEMLLKMSDEYLRQAWQQNVEQRTGIHLQKQPKKRAFSVPKRRAKIQLVENMLHDSFMVGILQEPSRLRGLPYEAEGFMFDKELYNRIYTRVSQAQDSEEYDSITWARQLQREFPEAASDIARWMNQEAVLDVEFASVVLDMRKALLQRKMTKEMSFPERARLAKLDAELSQELIKLNAEIEEQRRGSE